MIRTLKTLTACAAATLMSASLFSSPAFAGGEEDVDIFVAQTAAGGQVVLGAAPGVDDGDFTQLDVTTRVFTGELFTNGSGGFGFDDPGFFGLDEFDDDGATPNPNFPAGSAALPSGGTLTVSTRTFSFGGQTGDLFFYDALNDSDLSTVEFNAVGAGGPEFGFEFGASLVSSVQVPQDADSAGEDFDFHPDQLLTNPSGATPPGIYLVSLEASYTGLDTSDPIFLLVPTFDSDALSPLTANGEALETALDVAAGFVATQVPEPCSAVLAILAIGAVASPRRRASF